MQILNFNLNFYKKISNKKQAAPLRASITRPLNADTFEFSSLKDENNIELKNFRERKRKLKTKLKTLDYKTQETLSRVKITQKNIIFFEKILNNEELLKNRMFMSNIDIVLAGISSKEEAQAKLPLIDKILQDERFYNNPQFINHAHFFLYYCINNEVSEAYLKIFDTLLNDEELMNNNDLIAMLPDLMTRSGTELHSRQLCTVLSDKEQVIDKNFLQQIIDIWNGEFENYYGDIDITNFKKINGVLGKQQVRQLAKPELTLALKFPDLVYCKNFEDLTFKERKNILKSLISLDTSFDTVSWEFKKKSPLIPTSEQEFSEFLNKIVESFDKDVEDFKKEKFNRLYKLKKDTIKSLKDDKEFKKLNHSDKKIITLAILLEDIDKTAKINPV